MNCRGCYGPTDPVFGMDPMPLAGAFAATQAEALAEPVHPLTWERCRSCGLVNVEPDIPDAELFRHYRYAASEVPALVRHHAAFARLLGTRFPQRIVQMLEIGCNDGVLLKQLPAHWIRTGVDPSDVASAAATDYHLVNAPFTSSLDLGRFDLITSSNAFAHFTGIADAFVGVAASLRPGGEFWIEVHDLESTLASGQWDTIYHEHKVEWSEATLRSVAGLYGLVCFTTTRLPLHGGLLRMGFRHGPALVPLRELLDFSGLVTAYQSRSAPALPDGSVAYGAAGRATVYLNQVRPNVRAVIDGSSRRIGRWVPGAGLPILSPEEFGDPPAALITAWNHAADIRARHPAYDRWAAAW